MILDYNMHTFSWTTSILVLFLYIIVDALYVLYTKYIQQNKALASATTGSAMYGLFGFGTMAIVENPWNILFIIIGSWLGTYFMVKFYKDKKV